MKKILCALAIFAAAQSSAEAQARGRDVNCTYESCALGLAPAWNGLAITRGISERPIAVLGFFYPNDITALFEGDEAAHEAAREAVQMRTIAAALTDGGLLLTATGLARAAFQREFDGFSKALIGVGAASLGVSIPFQFAADGYLARAVWWHNRRYSTRP